MNNLFEVAEFNTSLIRGYRIVQFIHLSCHIYNFGTPGTLGTLGTPGTPVTPVTPGIPSTHQVLYF